MSFRPWHERFPELLVRERNAYSDAGLDFKLDEGLLSRHGIVVFAGDVQVVGQLFHLDVIYPSGFPYVHPEVWCDGVSLRRHQNPYEGNLCVVPNDTWRRTDTGAFVVQQAVALLGASHIGAAAVAERELDAPEPASAWYPYTLGAVLIILEPLPKITTEEFGTFRFAIRQPYPGIPLVQAILTDIQFASSRTGWTLPPHLLSPGAGQFAGCWFICSEPPPYLPVAQDRSNAFHQYWDWAKRAEPKLEYRMRRLKQGDMVAFAAVYPDEGPTRGVFHDNWLVGLKTVAIPQSMLLRPILFTEADRFTRMPSLRGLEKKKIAVIGLGALGSAVALLLARAGVGHITLVDPDFVDAGPIVRQEFDLRDVGLPKTYATAMRIRHVNPYTTVRELSVRLGGGPVNLKDISGARDSLTEFADIIKDHDLLIGTTAIAGVDMIINELGAHFKIPCVYTWVVNGAWGGRVFRSLPTQACFECLRYCWDQFPSPQEDPSETPLYARGCAHPTFTGTGFDAGAVANLAVRFAVQTILDRSPEAYPDTGANLITWSSRGPEDALYPKIEHSIVPRQEQCSTCREYSH
jgi:molybdopterin/thiamine biosynthesis adenylyltransferase